MRKLIWLAPIAAVLFWVMAAAPPLPPPRVQLMVTNLTGKIGTPTNFLNPNVNFYAGTNVYLDKTNRGLRINVTGGGGGESNTVSSSGSGVGIDNPKSGVNLSIKSFTDSSALLSWSSNGTEIDLSFDWATATGGLATVSYTDALVASATNALTNTFIIKAGDSGIGRQSFIGPIVFGGTTNWGVGLRSASTATRDAWATQPVGATFHNVNKNFLETWTGSAWAASATTNWVLSLGLTNLTKDVASTFSGLADGQIWTWDSTVEKWTNRVSQSIAATNTLAGYVRDRSTNSFRVAAGANITVVTNYTDDGVTVTVSGPAAGSGEVNTMSSTGAGVGINNPKSASDLPIKSFTDSSPLVSITTNSTEINFAFDWITATGGLATVSYANAATNALAGVLRAYTDAATGALSGVLVTRMDAATNALSGVLRAYTDSATGALSGVLVTRMDAATNALSVVLRAYADSATNALAGVLRAYADAATGALSGVLITRMDTATNALAGVLRAYTDGATNALAGVLIARMDAATNALAGVLRAYTDAATNALAGVVTANLNSASNYLYGIAGGMGNFSTNAAGAAVFSGSVSVASNLNFVTQNLTASSQTTNFIVDFAVRDKTNNLAAAIHFQHSTNRESASTPKAGIPFWTGGDNRAASYNANWQPRGGAVAPLLWPSNTMVLFYAECQPGGGESGVRFWVDLPGTNQLNDADIIAGTNALAGYARSVAVTNIAAEVLGGGTDYTLTGSFALVDFGTTDPSIVLPGEGTYLVMSTALYLAHASGAADVCSLQLRNSTDSTDVGSPVSGHAGIASGRWTGTVSAIVTVAGSKTIQLWAYNSAAARGTIYSPYTYIRYIRLY